MLLVVNWLLLSEIVGTGFLSFIDALCAHWQHLGCIFRRLFSFVMLRLSRSLLSSSACLRNWVRNLPTLTPVGLRPPMQLTPCMYFTKCNAYMICSQLFSITWYAACNVEYIYVPFCLPTTDPPCVACLALLVTSLHLLSCNHRQCSQQLRGRRKKQFLTIYD